MAHSNSTEAKLIVESLHSQRVRERILALDVLRGMAVVGMVFVHAVGIADYAGVERWLALPGSFAGGKASAAFSVLAGVTWSLQAGRQAGLAPGFLAYFTRRALGLAAIGIGFAFTGWAGQILTYFALYMACCLPLLRARTSTILAVGACVLLATSALQIGFGDWWEVDHPNDAYEEHVHAWDFGWGSLRYNFFDGIHPVLPWLIYPLAGILIGRVDWSDSRRGMRLVVGGLAGILVFEAWRIAVEAASERLGDAYWILEADWGAFSTPFFALRNLAWVAFVLGLLLRGGFLMRALSFIIPIGRLALSFYLLHVWLLILPLAAWWGWDEWPAAAGFAGASAFFVFAVIVGRWWLARWGQGPFERLLRWISGSTPRAASGPTAAD